MNNDNNRIIVALDYSDFEQVKNLVKMLDPSLCKLKVGKELFTSVGPDVIRYLTDLGYEIFLDLKFHDIPHTVAKACQAACELGVWMLNVHALGGAEMMTSARQAIDSVQGSKTKTLLIAVTILTSHDQQSIANVGLQDSIDANVDRLAKLALASGLDGVVCSAQEAGRIRLATTENFKLVTPGIRPSGSESNDQKRIMTPAQAISNGSDYLVIGRPVTQAQTPLKVLKEINAQIAAL